MGEDRTIYIISGFMRSGTSMMMRALEAGGLTAVFNPNRDRMKEVYGDDKYVPNPAFYELSRSEYLRYGFPRGYEGKLIKCLWGGLPKLVVVGDYRVVFMLRDPEEIRQSYEAFFDAEAPMEVLNNYRQVMQDSIGLLNNRKDTAVEVFQYRQVVKAPLPHFERLAQAGWPIDPVRAAAVVDPELCRFRLENLTTGIGYTALNVGTN